MNLLPTPTANDDNKSPEAHVAMKKRMGGGRKQVTSLQVLSKTDSFADDVRWGEYESAIRRWEALVGPAPHPTTLGPGRAIRKRHCTFNKDKNCVTHIDNPPVAEDWMTDLPHTWDRPVLSHHFVNWMMGLPYYRPGMPGEGEAWTGDLDRRAALKCFGNGVVPQQAYAALILLFGRKEAERKQAA